MFFTGSFLGMAGNLGERTLGEVATEEFGHAVGVDAILSEDIGHLFVGAEVLLWLWVQEVVFFYVGPQLRDALGARSLLHPDDVSQLGAEPHGQNETDHVPLSSTFWVEQRLVSSSSPMV